MQTQNKNIKKLSFFIAIIYFVVGFLWIHYSDMIAVATIDDVKVLTAIQTYKGWAYVFVTAIGLYFLTYVLFSKNNQAYENYLSHLLQSKQKLFNLAHYDALTKLPNRTFLLKELDNRCKRHKPFSLILLDLDGFKIINDSYGHSYGDKLIEKIATVISQTFDERCFVARVGGDEFAIIVKSIDATPLKQFIAKLYKRLNVPFKVDNTDVFITVSLGVSVNEGKKERETMLQEADAAMSNAKHIGKNTYSFFEQSFYQKAIEHTTITTKLQKAILNDEIAIFLQAQNEPGSAKIIGAEVLVRWKNGDNYIPPSVFIPIAEETGLIIELGQVVTEKAFLFAKYMHEKCEFEGKIAVNLSAKEITHMHFMQNIEKLLHKTGCDPRYIELEITESSILANPQQTIQTLQKLRETGFSIAIDDFGTGYSSLSYLKNLPLDKIKIDRSFVTNIQSEPKNQTIISAITTLAKGLNVTLLAEGVETEEELRYLRSEGIESIQGYIFSKPSSTEDFEKRHLQKTV